MSYSSILFAVKDAIINKISFNKIPITEFLCDVTVDGRPPSNSGEMFIAVHQGGFRGQSMEYLDILYSMNITITMRTNTIPFDRIGKLLIIEKDRGLGNLVKNIIEHIHMNYHVLIKANKYITEVFEEYKGYPENKWIEPLRFSSCTIARYVGSEWFHAEKTSEEGVTQTISFDNARIVKITDCAPVTENLLDYNIPGITDIFPECKKNNDECNDYTRYVPGKNECECK